MPTMIQDAKLQIVIQFGGTSDEYYLHAFANESAANKYIRKANRASYRCLGPLPLALYGVRQLAAAAQDVLTLLEEKGLATLAPAERLTAALAEIERELELD